jgi:hypothetical protein
VNAAGNHLLSLINEVLDLAKIEAGKLELNPEPVNLARLIDEVIGTAGQLAEKNKNRLVVEAQENLGALNRVRRCPRTCIALTGRHPLSGPNRRLSRSTRPWRGKRLGNPKLSEARRHAVLAGKKADRHFANVLPVILGKVSGSAMACSIRRTEPGMTLAFY